jgi:hypothetical protein
MLLLVLYLFCILCFIPGIVFSAPIDLQLGARPQALGGAFVALSDDSDAIWWNPAGLSLQKTAEISFMHQLMAEFNFVYIDSLGFTKPIGRGGIGLGWFRVGAQLKEGIENKASSMSENIFTLGYGISLVENVRMGIIFKRLTLDSVIGSGAGFGFDIGGLWKIKNIFSIALVFRNVATDVKNESFPSTMRIGFAWRIFKDRLRLAFDVDTKDDINSKKGVSYRWHTGLECEIKRVFLIRLGADVGNFAIGFGLNFPRWRADYAFLSRSSLSSLHRIALSLKFGDTK